MRRPSRPVIALLVAAAFVSGCSSKATPKAQPSSTPSPSPSTTPSPTPKPLPSVAADKATAKAALPTAAELGKPWVLPKKVNTVQHASGEICPGHKDDVVRVKPRAEVSNALTEGTKQGAAIASFTVLAFDPAKVEAWDKAFDAATAACASYKSKEGTYVVTENLASPGFTIDGVDVLHVKLEHIYAEASHKTLYYVRQTIKARIGRVVVHIEHAFIQPKTDPTGKDWTKTLKLFRPEVAKARAKFGL
jgi:hypothetical protein